jgi:uncharacterized protein (DUF488 family)
MKIWTIGHSTRAWDDFFSLLRENDIDRLVDVRSFPGSRRYPHFNRESMARTLKAAGLPYTWLPDLGGRRKPSPDSHNTLWRNEAFRGYADYMEGETFQKGLETLEGLAQECSTAFMCSEAVWWRCHRGMISDALKARGWTVLHILAPGKLQEHPFTPVARLTHEGLSYQPLL